MFTQKQLLEFIDKEFNQNFSFEQVQNPMQDLKEGQMKHADKYRIFDVKYYSSSLYLIENVNSPNEVTIELAQGQVVVTRKYVPTKSKDENAFTLYTHVFKKNVDPVASICMVHGNSECSDSFLDVALHHAMNGFDVHLIDLKGFGMSSGDRSGHFKIQEHHNQIVSMLQQVKAGIPCFIQAHSMGCLNSMNFFVNNPNISIDGFIAGSPFWGNGEKISRIQRILIWFLATFFEEMPLNGSGSTHFLSHDMDYFIHSYIYNTKKQTFYVSGGILNSMLESIEDIHENAKLFTKPLLVFMAGRDKIIRNNCSKEFMTKIKTPKDDVRIRWFNNSFHNIHKEPDYKFMQLAEIYEFIYGRLSDKEKPVTVFNPDDLAKVRVGRTLKRKSIKVKRTILETVIVSYLWFGIVILIIRSALRMQLSRSKLETKQILATVFVWPKYMLGILLTIYKF